MGRQLTIEPWLAIWMPSFILAPVGIFLTQRAAADSGLMSAEAWTNIIKKITKVFKKKNKEE